MNVEINLTLKKVNATLDTIIILHLLYSNSFKELIYIDQNTLEDLEDCFTGLEHLGFIKIIGELRDENNKLLPRNISLRDKALAIVETNSIDINVFTDEYRVLFPTGYKGDKSGCGKKLKQFLKKYPYYNTDMILLATKIYNTEITDTNGFRSQAHYVIDKNGISILASYCERILEGDKSLYGDMSNGGSEKI